MKQQHVEQTMAAC